MNADVGPAVSIPRIRTPRLLLREFRTGDFEAYASHHADPESTKHTSGPIDRRAAWRFFTAGAGMWMLNGAGWWAVEDLETHTFAGTVGAFYRESAPDGPGPSDLELGWVIVRSFWRRGYAAEAAAAALAHGIAAHAPKRVIAYIDPENAASIGVSRRLGMRFDADVSFYGEPTRRYLLEPS